MKRLAMFLSVLALAGVVHAAPITAPMVAGCPSPVPPSWPASSCKFAWYPLTDTTHAVSSAKGTPIYQHTLPGYVGAKWTGTILACPAGATVSGQACTDSSGKDVSAAIPLAQLNNFQLSTGGSTPPPPVTKTVTLTWTAPTANTDNSAITAGEITGYNVYLTPAGASMSKLGSTAAGVLTYITQPLGVGTYSFTVTAVAGAQESAQSTPVSLTIAGIAPPPPTPTPPANVSGSAQ